MKKKIFITLLLVSSCFINAQQQDMEDSLKAIIKQQNGDITEVDALSNLIYYSKQFDSAIKYAQQGLALAQKIKYKKGEADCYYSLATKYFDQENVSQAIQNSFNALKIYTDIEDIQVILFTRLLLQGSYKATGDYNSSLVYALPGEKMAVTTNMMGTKFGWQTRIAPVFQAEIGETYLLKNQPDSALIYTQKAITENALIEGAAWNWPIYLLGNIQRQKGNYELALTIYRSAIPLAKQNKLFHDTLQILSGMSTLFKMKGQLDSAIYCAQMVVQSENPVRQTKDLLDAVDNLAVVYKLTGDKDSALKYIEISQTLKDSMYNTKKDREIQNIAFNEQLKQQEIISAQVKYKSKVQLYMLVGGLFVMLFIAGILWRNNHNRKKAYALLQNQKQETDIQKTKVELTLEELKLTQSQLIQSEKMASLGELTAGIAHEIQNPLNFVNNFSEVSTELVDEMNIEIEKGNTEDAKIIAQDLKQNLEKINHHGKRAGDIVKACCNTAAAAVE